MTELPALPAGQSMTQEIFCPGFCGTQIAVTPPMTRQGLDAAWDDLLRHVHNCAQGAAAFEMFRQVIDWCITNLGEDQHEYFGGHTDLYSLEHRDQCWDVLRRMYTGRTAYDDDPMTTTR